MYLFSRRARLSGDRFQDAIEWATAITERVGETTGMKVDLWTRTFSPGIGTLVWSSFVPDLAALEAATDKLAVDDVYTDLVEKGFRYLMPGSVDDAIDFVLHGEFDPARHVEYVSTVRSTVTAGKLVHGLACGVEIAERAEKVTGVPMGFLASHTGNFGAVAWLAGFAGVAELQEAQQQLYSDESFLKFLDRESAGVFTDTPGATTQLVYRHIA